MPWLVSELPKALFLRNSCGCQLTAVLPAMPHYLPCPQTGAEEAGEYNSWFRNRRMSLNPWGKSSFLCAPIPGQFAESLCFFKRIYSHGNTTKQLTLIFSKRTLPNPNSQLGELKGKTLNGFKPLPPTHKILLFASFPDKLCSFNTKNCLGSSVCKTLSQRDILLLLLKLKKKKSTK